MKISAMLGLALALSSFTSGVSAHEKGSWIVRTGPIMVAPNDSSDVIDVAGIVTLPGVDVDSDTQLGVTGVYMFTDNIGLELLAATPFTHDITLSDLGIKAGSAKQLPPTLSLQYYFGQASSKFRPYAALGLNTTIFFEEDVDNELNLALDGIVGLPPGTVNADLKLDQSWGLSAQVGFDYMLNDHWMINGAVWYMDIDTQATVSTAVAKVKFDVDVDPYVYIFTLGYRF